MLLRESQVQLLLLVFEDLHWIDAETQALLDSLVESLPTARPCCWSTTGPNISTAGAARPTTRNCGSTCCRPPALTSSCTSYWATTEGARPCAPTGSQKALDCAHRGQPFLPGGKCAYPGGNRGAGGRTGAYRLVAGATTIQLPATVQAVLTARIDRLPPEEKRLLQTAAVIGTEVPLPLLQAIAELPEAALHRGLAHLQAAEFLYETRLFPEPDYTFKYVPTHEVAYGSPRWSGGGAARAPGRGPRGAGARAGGRAGRTSGAPALCGARSGDSRHLLPAGRRQGL